MISSLGLACLVLFLAYDCWVPKSNSSAWRRPSIANLTFGNVLDHAQDAKKFPRALANWGRPSYPRTPGRVEVTSEAM